MAHSRIVGEYAGLESEFRERFRVVTHPAMVRAERRVTGGDFGATSYTTTAQADDLARLLHLGPDKMLLDIGSGSGWPGNYLAKSTGCNAYLTDPTWEGMVVAAERSHREGLRSSTVVSSGDALPFRDSTFDACSSSDVFC